jgi:hypothetical protein
VSDSQLALAAVLAEASNGAAEAQGVAAVVQQHQQQRNTLLHQLQDCLSQATAAAAAAAAADRPSPSSQPGSSTGPGPTAAAASPAVHAVHAAVQDDEDGGSTAAVLPVDAVPLVALPVSLADQLAGLQGLQQELKGRVLQVGVLQGPRWFDFDKFC